MGVGQRYGQRLPAPLRVGGRYAAHASLFSSGGGGFVYSSCQKYAGSPRLPGSHHPLRRPGGRRGSGGDDLDISAGELMSKLAWQAQQDLRTVRNVAGKAAQNMGRWANGMANDFQRRYG